MLATPLLLATLLYPGSAASAGDITPDILAGHNVTLSGDAVVTLPPGTTTYDGVISGEGTLRITGPGTLVLTKDSDFTLPRARQRQRVSILGGNHPYVVVRTPDPPSVIVDRGATLQYGNGGGAGLIGRFPYNTPGYQLNQDNIEVNGTLRLSLTRTFNLGTISGSGLVTQPRFLWGTLDLAGTQPFSGVIDNGTGTAAGKPESAVALPNARAILNQGTWTIDTPLDQTVVLRQKFYQREYGSDINVQSRPGSKVVLTGQYSYSDRGGDTDPSLSDPALNWRKIPHDRNKRGTNIKGADVQWGDGTTHQIFMPGTADTVYINLLAARSRSKLTFAYNGPVTLGAPIGGGVFHDTLKAPGAGDIVIKGVPGNDVTFAANQYYDGSTTIQRGAVLRLGGAQGDGSLLTKAELFKVVNDGSLIVGNSRETISLSKISGSGAFTQAGAATTRLTGHLTYTGPTTISRGTLVLTAGTLRSSGAVALTRAGARLDLTTAGDQTLRNLTTVAGTAITSGTRAVLTLAGKSTLAGDFQGGKLVNTGVLGGSFTVSGDFAQSPGGRLIAGGKPVRVAGAVSLAGTLQLARAGIGAGPQITLIDNAGSDPVTGAFAGVAEGTEVTVGGKRYAVTYRGGDGNDVSLTAVQAAAVTPSAPANEAPAATKAATGASSYWRPAGLGGAAVLVAVLGMMLVRRLRRRNSASRG
ncbi:autotransporter-associated beta strand protein [Kribbella sp. VKM Ac-2571]|uniref:autotransporter-associated beta strand repeat-containing protein n=1 Tax=Kribbella sp. VKM Ac-2571 TaxID=2512222 RepID=UPI00105C19C3|nr:autotransporter-associated beta strand repeat-containing protein [Kribbella sp. VKM Ac-2571]TDO58019.1 autotransporter-associated beta strand protein [Kribbella sp. VKM Ac-2571]